MEDSESFLLLVLLLSLSSPSVAPLSGIVTEVGQDAESEGNFVYQAEADSIGKGMGATGSREACASGGWITAEWSGLLGNLMFVYASLAGLADR